MRQYGANIVDPQTQALVARAGTTRAILRREIVDDETWENSWIVNEGMRPIGIEYRLVGAHAVDARMECYIGLDRGAQEQPFGERERDLLYVFLLGCPGFHREQSLALGLTWRTTHQYVVSVLKKFGVNGRLGLMA